MYFDRVDSIQVSKYLAGETSRLFHMLMTPFLVLICATHPISSGGKVPLQHHGVT